MYTAVDILNDLSNDNITKDEALKQLENLNIGSTPAQMMVNNPISFLNADKQIENTTELTEDEEEDDEDEFNNELSNYHQTTHKNYVDVQTAKEEMSKLVDEYFNEQKLKRLQNMNESSLCNFLNAAKNLYVGN